MASISEEKRKRGPSKWQVMIRRAGQPRIIKTLDTREAAERFAAECERQLDEEHQIKVNPAASLPASGQLSDEKLKTTLALFGASKRCLISHGALLATLRKHVGNVTIGELDWRWVERYVEKMRLTNSHLGRPYKYGSIIQQLTMISVVLKWRARQLKVARPEYSVDRSQFPKNWDEKRDRRLAPEEEIALMSQIRASSWLAVERYEMRAIVILALETGTRLQELVLAEWSEFNLHARIWNLPAQHTKSKTARTIPLSKRAYRLLRALKVVARKEPSIKVFRAYRKPNIVSQRFARLTAAACLQDLRFHDLRHEAIARFVLNPKRYLVAKLMKIVGHKDYATFDRYLAFRPSEFEEFMS